MYTNDLTRAILAPGRWKDEQLQPGKRFERPSLDRYLVQLHHHPQSVIPFWQRRIHDDRAEGRREIAAARLQRRQRQLRGPARILFDQGAGWAADLAASASRAR